MEVIGGVPEIFLRESLIDKPATWRIPVHLIHLMCAQDDSSYLSIYSVIVSIRSQISPKILYTRSRDMEPLLYIFKQS